MQLINIKKNRIFDEKQWGLSKPTSALIPLKGQGPVVQNPD